MFKFLKNFFDYVIVFPFSLLLVGVGMLLLPTPYLLVGLLFILIGWAIFENFDERHGGKKNKCCCCKDDDDII